VEEACNWRFVCLQEERPVPLHILRYNRVGLEARERLTVKYISNALFTVICAIVLSGVLFPKLAQAQQTSVESNLNCGVTPGASFSVTYTLDRSDLYEGDIANGTINFPECSDGSAGYAAARLGQRILCNAPYLYCVSNNFGNPFTYYVFHDLYDIFDPGVNPRGPSGSDVVIAFYENGTNPPEWVNSASFGISFYDYLVPYTATYSIYDATGDSQTLADPPLFTLTVHPDNSTDLGGPDIESSGCEGTCGLPINLTNGNTWIEQLDYSLPGLGGGLGLLRTWNSLWPLSKPVSAAGMFGDSWRSNYEESLQMLQNNQVKYWRGNGSAWTFTWNSTTQAYALTYPTNEYVSLTFNSSTTLFTLTYKNGSKEVFSNGGSLVALVDRNGNQTTLSYDNSNRLSQVTDATGRSLTFNYGNSNFPGQVTSIQDSVGTVATYTYAAGIYLTSVTYADGSVINYTSDPSGLITSVTDANAKTLESHTYNGLRQGLTSSKANGVDSLSLSYGASGTPILTDSLGHVTTYSVQ
jgi:YD repeat-containing protein